MTFAVLFPGQGSQQVGMGAELFASQADLLGERSDRILGWSLRDMCLDGPEEELTRTEHAQPALFAISFALWEHLRAGLAAPPAGAAGHSLGEYTALAAAGSLSYEQALSIVARRGEAMARAASRAESGMAALLGADLELAEKVCELRRSRGGRLSVANINAPGQVVVAGSAADIEWVVEKARELGVRRAIALKVAGAFHSSFMDDAAEEVGPALGEADFAELAFPVWSNTTAQPHHVEALATTLQRQVVAPVRFQESLENMAAAGIDTFIHVGPGDVTAGMARRTLDDVTVEVVSSLPDIPSAIESLVTIG
jgi:[acyl-carrier-protein] S-malonyltransferase